MNFSQNIFLMVDKKPLRVWCVFLDRSNR